MTAVLPETRVSELTFAGGLIGFPGAERYVVVELPDVPQLSLLRSLDVPDLEFVVVPPGVFFPDYAPEIDDASAVRLELTDAADAQVLVVLTVGARAEDATANLLAPIVINARNRAAAQVVLAGDWPLRAPLRQG